MSETKENQMQQRAISDGEYILSETDVPNQFYFYRKDNGILGEVGRMPMDMYQQYIMMKMMSGEITDVVMNNIVFDTSTDGKCIRLTIEVIENTIGLKPIVLDTQAPPTLTARIKSLFKRRK